jgi:hypothetical protein
VCDKGLAAKSRHPRGRDIRMRDYWWGGAEASRTLVAGYTIAALTLSARQRAWCQGKYSASVSMTSAKGVGRLPVLTMSVLCCCEQVQKTPPHVSAPGRRRRPLVRSAVRGCERAQWHAQSNLSHFLAFGAWRHSAVVRDTLHTEQR